MGIKRGAGDAGLTESQVDISEDEAALYDRQIRLWGLEAQKNLRNAKVLLIGMGGLGAEVAKNIVLAGVKAITLLDEKSVGPNDCTAQFFVATAESGKNRAVASQPNVQHLNPNVEIVSDCDSITNKDDEFFSQFNIVCATDCSLNVLLRLDKVCREKNIKFFSGDVWGMFGYCFFNLHSFTYLKESIKIEGEKPKVYINKPKTEKVLDTVEFPTLERALSFKSGKSGMGLDKKTSKVFFLMHTMFKFRETHNRYPMSEERSADEVALKSVRKSVMENLGFDESKISDDELSNCFGELSPVCAIVGGILAQEVIKAVCADQMPIKNFFLFNGEESSGTVECIG